MEKDYLQNTLASDSLVWNYCVSEKCAISACHILYTFFIDFEEHHKIIKPLGEKHVILYESVFIVKLDAVPSPEDILANLYSQHLPLCSHSMLKRVIQDSE